MHVLFIIALLGTTLSCASQASDTNMMINDVVVPGATITQLENTYGVKFIPGSYWYDRVSGAFGKKGGPCLGIGIAGLSIGGTLKADASVGGTGVFINGRELHPADVTGLQSFMTVLQGRYWADAYGNFGYENNAYPLGNLYQLFQAKFKGNPQSSYYKNNVWSGESTSTGKDGSFMYYSSKKSDGTTYEYFHD